MKIDLHTHSNHSDGSFSPSKLVKAAAEANGNVIALTDHNTVSGAAEFLAAGKEFSITTVAGVEISTEFEGNEFHLVGLFIPENEFDRLESIFLETHAAKEESNLHLAAELTKAGYAISVEELKSEYPDANINRAHFGKLLFKKGYVKSVKDAFKTLLNEENGFYIPPKRLSTPEAIALLKSAGAISILAHPFVSASKEIVENVLPALVSVGLDGMECRYSLYDEADEAAADSLSEKHGLLRSGGSDFHGSAKPDIALFSGKGKLKVPYEYYLKMKTALDRQSAPC